MQLRTVSILGVGLLGGSIGLAIKQRINSCRVFGYGHRSATLDSAMRRGAIDTAFDDPAGAVRGADLVILCTPVGVFPDMLRSIAPAVGDALLTDVGSTKRTVARLAAEMLPNPGRFVGSHPMAGSEKRGIEFARADLCDGALCIVTPGETTHPQTTTDIEAFWNILGMRTLRLSPAEHDRRVAQISHLPHALAAILVAAAEEAALPLAGKGFSDTTRVAGGDGGLWRDILIDNRDNMVELIGRLKAELSRFEALLEPAKAEELRRFLDDAASRRSRLPSGQIGKNQVD
jgi:prephenate dehydrogenase